MEEKLAEREAGERAGLRPGQRKPVTGVEPPATAGAAAAASEPAIAPMGPAEMRFRRSSQVHLRAGDGS